MPDGRSNLNISHKCYTRPKTNRAFWDRKGETNTARDKRVNRQLRRQGWKVIRIWQLPSAVYAALRYQLIATATYLPEDYLRLRLRFAKPRYQLITKVTYLPEDYLRLRLRFAKPRYQLITKVTYLAKPRFSCSEISPPKPASPASAARSTRRTETSPGILQHLHPHALLAARADIWTNSNKSIRCRISWTPKSPSAASLPALLSTGSFAIRCALFSTPAFLWPRPVRGGVLPAPSCNACPAKTSSLLSRFRLSSNNRDALLRPDNLLHRSAQQAEAFLDFLLSASHLQKIHFLWRPALPDPDDDLFLELAVAAHCAYIITYNLRDFRGAEKWGISTVTPADFLQKIKAKR